MLLVSLRSSSVRRQRCHPAWNNSTLSSNLCILWWLVTPSADSDSAGTRPRKRVPSSQTLDLFIYLLSNTISKLICFNRLYNGYPIASDSLHLKGYDALQMFYLRIRFCALGVYCSNTLGGSVAEWLRRWTCNSHVASSIPGLGAVE